MVEEELGRVAVDRASREDVRQLARQLIEPGSVAGREAFDLAKNRGIDVPQDLNEDYRSLMQSLFAASGGDFDVMYINAVLQEHERFLIS